jgi:hypothetical protein
MELVEGMRVTRVFAPATSFFAKALHRASPLSADLACQRPGKKKPRFGRGLKFWESSKLTTIAACQFSAALL